MTTTALADLVPVQLRNTLRAQWFFMFPVTDIEATLAKDVVGLKVEPGIVRRKKNGKVRIEEVDMCTLALGDREAVVDKEILPNVTIPGAVWAALMRAPKQAKAMRGLIKSGEIAVTSGQAFAA